MDRPVALAVALLALGAALIIGPSSLGLMGTMMRRCSSSQVACSGCWCCLSLAVSGGTATNHHNRTFARADLLRREGRAPTIGEARSPLVQHPL